MSAHTSLLELQQDQTSTEDGTRIFHDGSIKIRSLTESGELGWYVLARPISGAPVYFNRYFVSHSDGQYLKAPGMREAIEIRDAMLTAMVESRVQRQFSNDLRNI
jgi:hypothetical protein